MRDLPPEKLEHFRKMKEETGVCVATQILMWQRGYIIEKIR